MPACDRLSDLPLSIIHDILSRVPVRDAIRTCVLSGQWRYTWTTLPHLLFNCLDDEDELMERFDETTNNFISNVLLHHKGPIQRFEMSYACNSGIGNAEEWVRCLSRNDIRELIIQIDLEGDYGAESLKSSIYSCARLTTLKLWSFKVDPPPPTFNGFLFLKSAVLLGVKISADGFDRLVGNCPVLESLTLLTCFIKELKIRSHSLRNLQIFGSYKSFLLNAPLLDQMHVELTVWQDAHLNQSSVCNYISFLGGSTNVLELSGDCYFTKYLSIGMEFCHTTLVFHHLKFIELHEVSFTNTAEISVVAHLIIGAPNLHKIQIQARIQLEAGSSDVSSRDYFGFAPPNFALKKLKDVSLPFVCHYPLGMQIVKFLLETSPVLEQMELQLTDRARYDIVSAELLGLSRSSPNVRIAVMYVPCIANS